MLPRADSLREVLQQNPIRTNHEAIITEERVVTGGHVCGGGHRLPGAYPAG